MDLITMKQKLLGVLKCNFLVIFSKEQENWNMQHSLHFNRNRRYLVCKKGIEDGRHWKPRKSPTKQGSVTLFTEEYFTLQVLGLIQYFCLQYVWFLFSWVPLIRFRYATYPWAFFSPERVSSVQVGDSAGLGRSELCASELALHEQERNQPCFLCSQTGHILSTSCFCGRFNC